VNDDMLTPQSLFIEPPRRDRITAISSVVQRRPIVLVLGMHRSGTSLCSHVLSALGVDMADDIGVNLGNDRGHWERWEIVEFHDRILSLFNRDYLGRFHDFALPVAWWADPRVAEIRREIVAFLERRMGDAYFGFKDPRTVRLMPVWHQIINELKLAPKIVLCLRNPVQVARSLRSREGLDPANGEYRWLVHLIDFFRYASNLEFCAVEYEEWFDNPAANIEKLRKFLDLPWQQSEADLALLLSDIIDPSARHDDPGRREASLPLVRTLYKLARRAGQDGNRDQIAYIVSQFVSFQQLQRPLLQASEDLAKTAARFPVIELEAAALRTALGARDSLIESAERRASGAEGRLADAAAEIEAQRAQIAELSGEREARAAIEREASRLRATLAEREAASVELSRRADELLAAQQAAQAELAEREAAATDLSRRADELLAAQQAAYAELAAREAALQHSELAAQQHAAAAEAMQSQIAALQEAMAKAEEGAQQHAAAAAAMQAEVAGLRGGLIRAEREAQLRTVSEAALHSEIIGLRTRLTKAERDAQERVNMVAALQGEIEPLQETLAAARQVGRAAIAALQIGSAAPTKIGRQRRWRLPLLRFLGAGIRF
jgi:Sulfotransferase family